MARRPNRSSGFYDTIEYIGPRPQKKVARHHRPGFFGGWVILLIAVGAAFFFGKPLVESLKAEQTGTSVENVDLVIGRLAPSASLGERFAAASLQQTKTPFTYDDSYYKIDYPNGDISRDRGKTEDIVVRGYRAVGIDLQQLVHEDMTKHFREYPQFFKTGAPDPNIDHRRAANLQRFFERNGESLSTSRSDLSTYQAGDIVVWTRPGQRPGNSQSQIETHLGVIVPGPGDRGGEPWVVHSLDSGPKWENVLLDYQILGHYRYSGPAAK